MKLNGAGSKKCKWMTMCYMTFQPVIIKTGLVVNEKNTTQYLFITTCKWNILIISSQVTTGKVILFQIRAACEQCFCQSMNYLEVGFSFSSRKTVFQSCPNPQVMHSEDGLLPLFCIGTWSTCAILLRTQQQTSQFFQFLNSHRNTVSLSVHESLLLLSFKAEVSSSVANKQEQILQLSCFDAYKSPSVS